MRKHPLTAALLGALLLLLASGALVTRALANRIALHQRSQQGLDLLALAREHARAGRGDQADTMFLQAMLVTKGAFLEDPTDGELRDALARVKRERADYAESKGSWGLAAELRVNLARLEGRPAQVEPAARTLTATIAVEGLTSASRVSFYTWSADVATQVAEATSACPEVSLPPGEFLAVHTSAQGAPLGSYLLVADAGRQHELHLVERAAPPPGVFPLPPPAVLAQTN